MTDNIEAFTFGEPTPVLQGRDIFDYLECTQIGKYYAPPLSLDGLSKSLNAAIHHSSPIYFKRDILASCFIPHPLLSRSDFSRWALDFLVLGNCYMEERSNIFGNKIKLQPSLARYTRRGIDLDQYYFVQGGKSEHEYKPGSVHHLLEPDINQDIYGLPQYLAALNSAWLNESATLFRRKYYENGSHAGFILYMTDANMKKDDVKKLRQALKDSKGPGNFRNLMMYAPGGNADGIKLMPISEIAAKDEMFNIKNVTRDDLLAAHRVPPQLMGIIPTNSGGFSNPKTAAEVFARNELKPIQHKLYELNDWFGDEVVKFEPYTIEDEKD